jgi:hypothetical protein
MSTSFNQDVQRQVLAMVDDVAVKQALHEALQEASAPVESSGWERLLLDIAMVSFNKTPAFDPRRKDKMWTALIWALVSLLVSLLGLGVGLIISSQLAAYAIIAAAGSAMAMAFGAAFAMERYERDTIAIMRGFWLFGQCCQWLSSGVPISHVEAHLAVTLLSLALLEWSWRWCRRQEQALSKWIEKPQVQILTVIDHLITHSVPEAIKADVRSSTFREIAKQSLALMPDARQKLSALMS